MYTQLNQYHVILEAQPQFQLDPDKLNHIFIQANAAAGTSGAGASTSSGNGLHFGGIERADGVHAVHAVGEHAGAGDARAYGRDNGFDQRRELRGHHQFGPERRHSAERVLSL